MNEGVDGSVLAMLGMRVVMVIVMMMMVIVVMWW